MERRSETQLRHEGTRLKLEIEVYAGEFNQILPLGTQENPVSMKGHVEA